MEARTWLSCTMVLFVALLLFGCGDQGNSTRLPARATEYSQGITGHPGGLVPAPDGNLWFTEQFDDRVGVFDLRTKTATEFDVPRGTLPHNAIVGPDGNMWFTGLADNIGTFDFRTRTATIFREGISPGSEPHVSVTDPYDDNFIWFTEQRGHRLGRFDRRAGRTTEFNLAPDSHPHGMILDPTNNTLLWAEQGNHRLAVLDTSRPIETQDDFDAQYRQIAQFSPDSGPHDPLIGPDGNIYVTLQDASKLGRYDPRTGEIREYPTTLPPVRDFDEVLPPVGDPDRFRVAAQHEVQAGRELFTLIGDPKSNSIWFNEFVSGRIGRFDIATQTITEDDYGIAPTSGPLFVVIGSDDQVWFTEVSLEETVPGRIARLGK